MSSLQPSEFSHFSTTEKCVQLICPTNYSILQGVYLACQVLVISRYVYFRHRSVLIGAVVENVQNNAVHIICYDNDRRTLQWIRGSDHFLERRRKGNENGRQFKRFQYQMGAFSIIQVPFNKIKWFPALIVQMLNNRLKSINFTKMILKSDLCQLPESFAVLFEKCIFTLNINIGSF